MRARIENARFVAVVDSLGGELKSFVEKATGRELLWQADPAWWKGTAPLLFPIVGGLRGGSYRHAGREYKLFQHGFARGSEFELGAKGGDTVEFRLRSSAETRALFPFDFELRQTYSLGDRGYAHRATVLNSGSVPMLFSIGFHPAFNLPLGEGSLENHYLLTSESEDLPRWFFKDGLFVAGKTAEVFENSRVVSLSRSLFNEGPVIFRGPRSREFSLVNGRSGESLSVETGALPVLALWSKPGAPFVCVEAWHGLPDSTEASGELAEKEGILRLEPGAVHECGYELAVRHASSRPGA